MPHKHKRRKTSDLSSYDLPPTSIAKALPTKVSSNSKPTTHSRSSPNRPTKRSRQYDDTPRAFTRMLAFRDGNKLPSGLDDGYIHKKSKIRASNQSIEPNLATSSSTASLQRLPHESMSAFSQRVNAALPISGLSKSRPSSDKLPSIKGLRSDGTKQTRMEKKMQKMQQAWREAKKRREEALQDEDEDSDDKSLGSSRAQNIVKVGATQAKRTKSSRKRRRRADESDNEDPWAELNARKRASVHAVSSTDISKGLVGLHDVVVAPPKLCAPRAVFGDMKDIPKGTGSLRRREELSKARAAVLNAIKTKARHLQSSIDSKNND